MRLLVTLGLLVFAALTTPAADPVRLIAHRGGIVDAAHPENSASAVEAAIRRGYWMVEIDLQESGDGRVVVAHGLYANFGELRQPRQMKWDEISRLRARADGSPPLELAALAALCRGRIRLMLDTKESVHTPAFFPAVEQALSRNQLLATAYFIGAAEARAYFRGKARVAIGRDALRRAMAAGEDTAQLYFLFEHGRELDAEGLELARRAGVPAVASVNDLHYAGQDHMQAAGADIRRLRGLGVTLFQIDSFYERWLAADR